MSETGEHQIIHASSVAIAGRAVLIIGRSGSGKSALAIDLISRGCRLVADDRTCLRVCHGALIASTPDELKGKIEARNIGILAAPPTGPQIVALIVDLDQPEPSRLPERHTRSLLGVEIDLINGKGLPNMAPAVHLFLSGGRQA